MNSPYCYSADFANQAQLAAGETEGPIVGMILARIIVESIENYSKSEDLILRLFANDVSVTVGDSASKFSEARFTGYKPCVLKAGQWKRAYSDSGDLIALEYDEQVFKSSAYQATEKIYGYFITQASDGKLFDAHRFEDAPNPITNLNDQIQMTPAFGGKYNPS
jgi:hypothetical protein